MHQFTSKCNQLLNKNEMRIFLNTITPLSVNSFHVFSDNKYILQNVKGCFLRVSLVASVLNHMEDFALSRQSKVLV